MYPHWCFVTWLIGALWSFNIRPVDLIELFTTEQALLLISEAINEYNDFNDKKEMNSRKIREYILSDLELLKCWNDIQIKLANSSLTTCMKRLATTNQCFVNNNKPW